MEGLGWGIYLCSISGGLKMVSLVFFIVCIVGAGLTLAIWLDNACTLATARKKKISEALKKKYLEGWNPKLNIHPIND